MLVCVSVCVFELVINILFYFHKFVENNIYK